MPQAPTQAESTPQPAATALPTSAPTPTAKETLRQIGPAALLGFFWAACPAVLGIVLITQVGPVADWLVSLGPWGWVLYVAIFIFSAGVGFLPTYGQSALGGWTFGFWLGFPGAMLGFVGGSVIGYKIARMTSKHKVEAAIEKYPKAKAVRDALVGRGFWRTLGTVTLIRLPPNSPFAVTNLVLASAEVRFLPYLLGTAIGMAPRTAITVWFVHWARNIQQPPAQNLAALIKNTPTGIFIAGIVSTIVMLLILAYISNKAIAQVTGPSKPAPPIPA